MSVWLWVVAAWAVEPDALEGAAISPDLAEYNRLSQELERLTTKNAWAGVERTFSELLATGVAPSFDDWYRGAQSARTQGDIAAVRERLTAANALHEERSVVDWLWDIDSRFARVSLTCDPGSLITLRAEGLPLDPDLRRAIEFAQRNIRETCAFDGFLPEGRYWFFEQELQVMPRVQAIQVDLRGIEIDRRTRRELRRQWSESDSGLAGSGS